MIKIGNLDDTRIVDDRGDFSNIHVASRDLSMLQARS